MTEITREKIEARKTRELERARSKLTKDKLEIDRSYWEFELENRIKEHLPSNLVAEEVELRTLALKALEQPTPSQDTVEAVARAMCHAKFWDGEFDNFGEEGQDEFRKMAKAAIAAYEARSK